MHLIETDMLPIADSPRIYVSTNPWKITATFHTISSTREEYIATIESLKTTAPPELKKGQKRSKPEQLHLQLITALEARIEAIDAEFAVSGEFRNIYPIIFFSLCNMS
jgi:hypothetical protein